MSDSQYPDLKKVQFYEQLLPRLAALPGVESVSAGFPLPLSQNNIGISFSIEGPAKLSITRPNDHFADSEMLFLFANLPGAPFCLRTIPKRRRWSSSTRRSRENTFRARIPSASG